MCCKRNLLLGNAPEIYEVCPTKVLGVPHPAKDKTIEYVIVQGESVMNSFEVTMSYNNFFNSVVVDRDNAIANGDILICLENVGCRCFRGGDLFVFVKYSHKKNP